MQTFVSSSRSASHIAALICALLALAALAFPAALAASSGDRFSWVFFTDGGRNTTMSGSTEDLARARQLRSGNAPLLYVRREGTAWVIRDPATLERARAIFAPQQALGARQAALGSRQAALGSRQAALGAEQGRLGSEQGRSSPARQDELGRRQAALGRQQDALGRQQDELGRQQSALGREQDRLARAAEARLAELVADAIRSGAAQRAD